MKKKRNNAISFVSILLLVCHAALQQWMWQNIHPEAYSILVSLVYACLVPLIMLTSDGWSSFPMKLVVASVMLLSNWKLRRRFSKQCAWCNMLATVCVVVASCRLLGPCVEQWFGGIMLGGGLATYLTLAMVFLNADEPQSLAHDLMVYQDVLLVASIVAAWQSTLPFRFPRPCTLRTCGFACLKLAAAIVPVCGTIALTTLSTFTKETSFRMRNVDDPHSISLPSMLPQPDSLQSLPSPSWTVQPQPPTQDAEDFTMAGTERVWTSLEYLDANQKRLQQWIRDFGNQIEKMIPSPREEEEDVVLWDQEYMKLKNERPLSTVFPYIVSGEPGNPNCSADALEDSFCKCDFQTIQANEDGTFSCNGVRLRCETSAVPFVTSFINTSTAEWGLHCPASTRLSENVYLHIQPR